MPVIPHNNNVNHDYDLSGLNIEFSKEGVLGDRPSRSNRRELAAIIDWEPYFNGTIELKDATHSIESGNQLFIENQQKYHDTDTVIDSGIRLATASDWTFVIEHIGHINLKQDFLLWLLEQAEFQGPFFIENRWVEGQVWNQGRCLRFSLDKFSHYVLAYKRAKQL